MLQLDRTPRRLCSPSSIEAVGLERTLIVLSADPRHARDAGSHDRSRAPRVGPPVIPRDVVGSRRGRPRESRFRRSRGAVRSFFRPYLYLEREAIEAAGSDPDEVEQAIAAALTDMDGIALAVARSALPTLQETELVGRVRRNAPPLPVRRHLRGTGALLVPV